MDQIEKQIKKLHNDFILAMVKICKNKEELIIHRIITSILDIILNGKKNSRWDHSIWHFKDGYRIVSRDLQYYKNKKNKKNKKTRFYTHTIFCDGKVARDHGTYEEPVIMPNDQLDVYYIIKLYLNNSKLPKTDIILI